MQQPFPECPRCGYDLSGLVASWTSACPLTATCSECGLEFGCADVLVPLRHLLDRFFEHARGLRRCFTWAWITWGWTVAPWRFWNRVQMHHTLRPRRVLLWPMWLLLPFYVVGAILYTAAALSLVRGRPPGAGPPAAWDVAALFNGWLRPFAQVHEWWNWPTRRCEIAWFGVDGWTPGVWAGLVGTAMFGLLLSLLPVTRRRVHVRAGHLWRAIAFGFAWLVPVAALHLITMAVSAWDLRGQTFYSWSQTTAGASNLAWRWRYAYQQWWPIPLVLIYGWVVCWWWLALSRGMKLPEPRRHFLVLLVPVTMAVVAAILLSQTDNWSFMEALIRMGFHKRPLSSSRSRWRRADYYPRMSHDPLSDSLLALLRTADPQVGDLMSKERDRQEQTLELIASENHVSPAVMHTMGSWLTNKYAEGYPGARYYGGCEFHDAIETIARDRAKQLFGCAFANVQPHSGAQANTAAFMALLQPGDTFASLVLKDGGHLSHGMKINFSGTFFKPVHYPLHYDKNHPEHERIDYEAVRRVCLETKPKAILCGYSAYPRVIDFARFRTVADEVGAYLVADIAHIAGLVAAGVHPSPFPHAHVVTTTTHKTLRGPRGGLILTNDEETAKKIDKAVFPGVQGGPLMHIIAAKAVAFGEALRPEFKAYCTQIVANARALAAALIEHGYRITSGGTDNHLMLVDLRQRSESLTGADAEKWLESAGIVCNKNGIPDDPRPPRVTSGLRLGTPAVTTRGLKEKDLRQVAAWIDRVLGAGGEPAIAAQVRAEVRSMCGKFPMPGIRA